MARNKNLSDSRGSTFGIRFFLLMLKSDELEEFLNRLRQQIQAFEQKEAA